MPLIFNNSSHQDLVALWQIKPGEFSGTLGGNALSEMQNLRLIQKQACLRLVSVYAGENKEVFYDDHGKPHLANDNRTLSFSHSGIYAAIMLSERFAGIDFELIRPKVLNIIHKFLNDAEMASLSPISQVAHAHVYWGAKESLYKVYGKQQLAFKENILLEPFTYKGPSGFLNGRIITEGYEKKFKLYYEEMFGFMMVHIVN